MPESQLSAKDRDNIQKLIEDAKRDPKLQMRLINNSPDVLKEYHLEGNPKFKDLTVDLHPRARQRVAGGEVTGLFGIHVDLEGGHNDSEGHTDGPSWHFDL